MKRTEINTDGTSKFRMNRKIILGLLFTASFSIFTSFNHPAYAGFICSPHSTLAKDGTGCVCDPGYTPNGFNKEPAQPICILASVGGMGIPIDSTALLLAGVQGSALWMIPAIVVAGAGIGIVSFRKLKKKQD